ncbi:Concanavalin A-like lectin/glucanase [Metarhizium rileyi]|uniref:Concanavalin A-like lectin/glucanase n=1 Tax=Metarhizium rileyi (strain RCEF 4871) TaxID=1649241 RepID=A0A167JLH1_METRR|nr:Concanavalin A-like lectin/glucanase [Metarhizium rileyi RCEF 4871]
MHRPAIFLSTCFSVLGLVHDAASVSDSSCDCFLTNGSQPTYFANHHFLDFRNLQDYASVPDVISNAKDTPTAPPTSDYFTADPWTKTWAAQTWSNTRSNGRSFSGDATILMINSPNNVYIQQNKDASASSATHLALRTSRLASFQTAAEMQTQASDYHYLSLRILARTVGPPGAVSAVFTYRDAKELANIQEADMEIVTRGPKNVVQFTNQPGYTDNGNGVKPNATRNSTLPQGLKWSDWAVYRMDWTPTTSIWYVNGEEVANITYQVPRDPAAVNLNSWGDGGSWSGNMSVGAESSLQLQWIEMVYNTTENNKRLYARRHGAGGARSLPRDVKDQQLCGAVCSIDEGAMAGAVAKLWGEKSLSARTPVSLLSAVGTAWLCLAMGGFA